MIAIRTKIKAQGWRWFMRRVLREILQPVTKTGKYLKPFKFAIYVLLCKPMDILKGRGYIKEGGRITIKGMVHA
ncbi:MAG: hypothetical protein PWK00_03485, partial [Coxiella burnetii]|nr:hypothetical protein [Coxiella burnetii]